MIKLTRRRVVALLALAVLAAAASWCHLYRPWEARYLDRPTSWWAAAAGRCRVSLVPQHAGPGWERPAVIFHEPSPAPPDPLTSLAQGVLARLGVRRPPPTPGIWKLVDQGDPEALPVLLELSRRPEPRSRLAATPGLARLCRAHPAAYAALEAATADPDSRVRLRGQGCLGQLGPGPADWPDWPPGVRVIVLEPGE
jgi:hypothetical protein